MIWQIVKGCDFEKSKIPIFVRSPFLEREALVTDKEVTSILQFRCPLNFCCYFVILDRESLINSINKMSDFAKNNNIKIIFFEQIIINRTDWFSVFLYYP